MTKEGLKSILLPKSELLGDTGLFSLAQATAGITFAVYIFVTARILGRQEFALFQAIIGVYGILSIFGSPLNIAAIHVVASASEETKRSALGGILRLAFRAAITVAILVLVLSSVLQDMLQCHSITPLISLAMLTFADILLTTFYGGLQGRNRYGMYAGVKIAESVIVFVVGTLLVLMGWGAAGAVAAYAIGMTASFVFLLTQRRLYTFRATPHNRNWRYVISTLKPISVFGVLLLIINYPMVLAKMRLSHEEAGIFGSLFALRNLVLPFAYAVAVPLYSRRVSGSDEPHILPKAFLTLLLMGGIFLAVSIFSPELFIRIFLGSKYLPAAKYLFLYGIALILHMLSMAAVFNWAAGHHFAFAPLAVPVLTILGTSFLGPPTVTKIIMGQIAALFSCLAIVGLWWFIRTKIWTGSTA